MTGVDGTELEPVSSTPLDAMPPSAPAMPSLAAAMPSLAAAMPSLAAAMPSLAAAARVLLLGIGNDLRGDDGAGRRVVRALEGRIAWDLREVHGLTPELADDLALHDVVLFVDASADPTLERPTWIPHPPHPRRSATSALLGHALDAPALLALTDALHGRAPQAATLALPARDFDLAEHLTPFAEAGVERAVAMLVSLAAG